MQLVNTRNYSDALHRQLRDTIQELYKRGYLTTDPSIPSRLTQSQVRDAIKTVFKEMTPVATNVPTTAVQAAAVTKAGAKKLKAADVLVEIEKLHARAAAAGSISITLVGEQHNNLDGSETADLPRARTLMQQMIPGGRLARMTHVVFERGMAAKYNPLPPAFAPAPIREDDIPQTHGGELEGFIDNDTRDLMLAAYLVLSLASGNQATNENIVIFRGAEHAAFLDTFEYFAKTIGNVTGVDWVGRRPRHFLTVGTQA